MNFQHPNWVALSTVHYQWKNFVHASDELPQNCLSKEILHSNISGEDCRTAYEEVLTLPSQSIKKELICEKKCTEPTTSGHQQVTGSRWINALMKEASANNVQGIENLLGDQSNLNITDQFGWTMLMCASHAGAVDVIQYLLERKADTSIKDKSGFTCLSLAKRQKNYSVHQLLKNYSESNVYKCESVVNEKVSKVFCDICRQHFEDSPSKPHRNSTVHLFNTHPRKHTTWYGIPDNNKGFELMVKSGWDREQGLGPEGMGTKVPPKTVFKTDRKGFGIKTDIPRVTHFKACDTQAVASKHRIHKEQKHSKSRVKSKISSERRKERYLRRELNF